MFQCLDRVLYGTHGVCTILCFEERMIDRKTVQYYVLEPTMQPGARFYVPVHNPVAVSKMRPLLERNELETLLHSDEAYADAWIADENQRKQKYRELISSGDRVTMISMIRTLSKQKQMQIDAGKKFHLCDENFLRDALKMICSEIAVVFGLSQEQLSDFMKNTL